MIATMTDDTKAVLLLCGNLSKDGNDRPLTPGEYTRVVRWLVEMELKPADLLQDVDVDSLATKSQLDRGRLVGLLKRGVALAFAVEEWERNGIWVVSRSDAQYPTKLKQHLKSSAPPILYGTGEIRLCDGQGLGMVGSRNVDSAGEIFARNVAETCARSGLAVVSGGARGVDQISMLAATESGGIAIGVLAEHLLKKSVEREARELIADGRLVLLSPYHPQAPFSVGNAMGRNKLIYGLADYTLVVSTDYKKGGTWTGAEEELKRPNHRPVFVRIDQDCPVGNRRLLEIGAIGWPGDLPRDSLVDTLAASHSKQLDLNKSQGITPKMLFDVTEGPSEFPSSQDRVSESGIELEVPTTTKGSLASPGNTDDVFQAVLPIIKACTETPMTSAEIAKRLNVVSSQVKQWLEQAVTAGVLEKKKKPVRYVLRGQKDSDKRETLFPADSQDLNEFDK